MTQGAPLTLRRPAGGNAAAVASRFRVGDWMGCASGRQSREDWLAWARGGRLPGPLEPEAPPRLPTALRRRITGIGQMAFRAVYGLGQIPPARFVFCSRHGEFRRTTALLETLAGREMPSPAEFSLSVHNALAGLLSIVRQNEAGHTAIAAGTDSFGFGLLEAAACLATRPAEPILLVYFDEGLPGEYAALSEGEEESVALALLLTAAQGDEDDVLLSLGPPGDPPRPAAEAALDFMRFLLSGESERRSPGSSVQWRWYRDAA